MKFKKLFRRAPASAAATSYAQRLRDRCTSSSATQAAIDELQALAYVSGIGTPRVRKLGKYIGRLKSHAEALRYRERITAASARRTAELRELNAEESRLVDKLSRADALVEQAEAELRRRQARAEPMVAASQAGYAANMAQIEREKQAVAEELARAELAADDEAATAAASRLAALAEAAKSQGTAVTPEALRANILLEQVRTAKVELDAAEKAADEAEADLLSCRQDIAVARCDDATATLLERLLELEVARRAATAAGISNAVFRVDDLQVGDASRLPVICDGQTVRARTIVTLGADLRAALQPEDWEEVFGVDPATLPAMLQAEAGAAAPLDATAGA